MHRTRPAVLVPSALLLAAGAAAALAGPPADLHGTEENVRLAPAVHGRSGMLRVAVADPWMPVDLPMEWDGSVRPWDVSYRWMPLHGTAGESVLGSAPLAPGLRAPSRAGIWRLQLQAPPVNWSREVTEMAVITRVPFSEKRGGYLNGYRIGFYATEREGRTDQYAPPAGFIEVTRENQDLYVSAHFQLRNFLTKDQFPVWPKYLALDLRLIDKLELVIQELNAMGVRAEHMAVMSGFRTPAYNGPGEGGRARLSRHTYGDASDVWIDNDRDGYMDDLNQDGRRDIDDALVMLRAVDRVEARYPELTGGAGVYHANSAHGPFIHIDARGYRSRW